MFLFVVSNISLFSLPGTKTDLRTDSATIEALAEAGQVVVEQEAGKDLASKVGAVDYVECSALTQEGIEEVFNKVGASTDIYLFHFYFFRLFFPQNSRWKSGDLSNQKICVPFYELYQISIKIKINKNLSVHPVTKCR